MINLYLYKTTTTTKKTLSCIFRRQILYIRCIVIKTEM